MGIDGEAIALEWEIVPGFSTFSILQEIQKDLEGKNMQPENFEDQIIFMSMFNDILWNQMIRIASRTLRKSRIRRRNSFRTLHFSGSTWRKLLPCGNFSPLCRDHTSSRVHLKTKALAAFPAGTSNGPVSEVHVVKILDEHGKEGSIPSICKPGDTTLRSDIKRDARVNEIHDHKEEVRSGDKLLGNLQEC